MHNGLIIHCVALRQAFWPYIAASLQFHVCHCCHMHVCLSALIIPHFSCVFSFCTFSEGQEVQNYNRSAVSMKATKLHFFERDPPKL